MSIAPLKGMAMGIRRNVGAKTVAGMIGTATALALSA